MSTLLSVVSATILLLVAYWRWKKEDRLRDVFWPALFFKLTAGLALGLIYTYYYPAGDTFSFFHDADMLTAWGKKDFVSYLAFLWSADESTAVWKSLAGHEYRVLFFSRMVSMVNFFTGSNYWITSLYFSFLAFLCSVTLVRTIIRFFPEMRLAAIISFLFLPSVVFWGSGVVKECVALASLFFLAAIFLRVIKNERCNWIDWLLAILFCWLLWKVKYYYAAVFLIVTITGVIVKFTSFWLKLKSPVLGLALWLVVFTVPVFFISLSRENFHYENFFHVIVQNYEAYQHLSKPGAAIQYHDLEPNGWSILQHAPLALFSGLFRPFFWEVENIFQLLAAFENAVLLLLATVAIRKWRSVWLSTEKVLIFSTLAYCVLLCIFLALSTPNFGTLSRYRTGFLPFLFFLVSCDNIIVNRVSTLVQRSFLRLVP